MQMAGVEVISGRWVVTSPADAVHKARYVLRGFEEDTKDEDGYASTAQATSVRLLLAFASGLRPEAVTVFTADVKIAFLNVTICIDTMLQTPLSLSKTKHMGPVQPSRDK